MEPHIVKEQASWPDPDSYDLYQRLMERLSFHEKACEDAAQRNYWYGTCLGLAIPIVSAIVMFLAGFRESLPAWVVALSGLVLTILTVVNSTLKPNDKFFILNLTVRSNFEGFQKLW